MITFTQEKFLTATNCIKLSNGKIDMLVSLDFGPRILFFGSPGGKNQLYVNQKDFQENRGQESYRFYGGHRLWAAPEDPLKTYVPDNEPVQWRQNGKDLTIIQPASQRQPLEKELCIRMDEDRPLVTIHHYLTNQSPASIRFAAWALTQVDSGGMAIMPLPPRGSHGENLLPTSSLVLWAYTNLADPRWRWDYQFIRVQQDPTNTAPLKFGMSSAIGWLAYANHGQIFIKQTRVSVDQPYPDRDSSLQIFLNDEFLELETLAPIADFAPQERVEHVETWQLIDDVHPPEDDESVVRDILPYVKWEDK